MSFKELEVTTCYCFLFVAALSLFNPFVIKLVIRNSPICQREER